MYSQQLKIFLKVAQKGSFSKAAEDLFVTPASVMKQMNILENRLGVILLKRTNHGIILTEAGKYIYNHAQKFVAKADETVARAKVIQQNEAMTIRVGSSFLNPSSVLIDLWNKINPAASQYRIKIIPYDDKHDQIMSVIASLGKTMDFMVGVFNSRQMLSISRFLNWAVISSALPYRVHINLLKKRNCRSTICTVSI